MMTQHAVHSMDLPPPRERSLIDLDRTVGWTSGRTIGFVGFADEQEAAGAAWLAHRTMARRLAREGGQAAPVDVPSLALVRRGGREMILADGRPIATLLRPGLGSRAGTDWFAFEVDVPKPAGDIRVQALAYLAYRTMRSSNVAWELLAPPERSIPSPATGVAEDDAAARVNHHAVEPSWWTRLASRLTSVRGSPSASALVAGVLLVGLASIMLVTALVSAAASLHPAALVTVAFAIATFGAMARRARRPRWRRSSGRHARGHADRSPPLARQRG